MPIDPLEKKWLAVALGLIGVFLGAIFLSSVLGIKPPSHVETIDSARLHLSEEFAEDKLGVHIQPDGRIEVVIVAGRYGFYPRHLTLPADTPITFRFASLDVLHGVHLPMTNLSTMIVPGYVAKVTTVFPKPGDYPLLCNEYCGLGHDYMWSKVTVVDKPTWEQQHAREGGPS
ncbi:cytochrome c oxidase subunit II [Methylothermus subterraneus]